MKKRILSFSVSCFLTTTLFLHGCKNGGSSCGEEKPPKVTTYRIETPLIDRIPYSGMDTLFFVSNDSIRVMLVGQGKREFMDILSVDRDFNPDCADFEYFHHETIEFNFVGNINQLSKVSVRYTAEGTFDEKLYIDVNGENKGLINLDHASDQTTYKDTIHINGQIYPVTGLTTKTNDTIKTTYYNRYYGLMKIKFNNGKEWTLTFK